MFVVPISRRISWSNPPIVTLVIIAVNVLVFFFLQGGDEERFQRAEDFYRSSGLSRIEAERYVTYVRDTGGAAPVVAPEGDPKQPVPEEVLIAMRADKEYLARLQSGKIIVGGDARYPEWHRLRLEYDGLLKQIVGYHYALIPSQLRGWDLLTHMFLHGGLGHLLGNMVFLWLVGCVIEMGCGRAAYAVLYVLGGLGAAALYTLVYLKSTVPCIGASGAIAGLMGAYTVLYGRQKIKVFYSLGFFFNYTTIPAILLLPLWLGNEIFGLFLGSYTNVAYVAHLGGLLSGASLGFVLLRFTGVVDLKAFADDPASRIPALMENALKLVSQLDLQQARPIVLSVLGIDPEHRQALKTLFGIDKQEPQSGRFDATAARLLSALSKKCDLQALHEYYTEYSRLVTPPRLNPDLLLAIAGHFPAQGHYQEAEKILAFLLHSQPGHIKLPPAILRLGREYLKSGMNEKGSRCLQIVGGKFPGSPEALAAAALLRGIA